MTKHHKPEPKQWIPLGDIDVAPFDQTNGVVDFDPGPQSTDEDVERDMLERGAASNTINAGFFGGGGI